jgi:hypothetical protein
MRQPLQHLVSNPLERLHPIRYIQRVIQYVDLVESNQLCTYRPRSTMSVVDNIRRRLGMYMPT